jgi:hypothetical protein
MLYCYCGTLKAYGFRELDRWYNKAGVLYVLRSDGAILERTKHRSLILKLRGITFERWLSMTGKAKKRA